ncbi:uncharacterized protein MELLADRAFT_107955 [Melampsora larici-populina 98AG31]|uniref:Uncharacterized protein n=1 Tax=Melampsora larici-populina (strain 98AG31 / pathotype 3-4-7) TaxID=747676 RepID=F4RRH8_MELLP|nr:uncharacterized protein MELLADRAFT_107955 [Melampsora larici-populina 98AG31]EGG05027.1 hypothetical protein MELLADRAFT_107955 [Melampsora larici-populina 98AG31]
MANKKKDRPCTFESLNQRPQNPLDARVLALKRKAREQTLQRHGQEPLGPPQVPVNTTPIADPTQVLDDDDNNDPNDEMDDHMNAPPLDPSMDPPEVVLVDDDAIHALNRGCSAFAPKVSFHGKSSTFSQEVLMLGYGSIL